MSNSRNFARRIKRLGSFLALLSMPATVLCTRIAYGQASPKRVEFGGEADLGVVLEHPSEALLTRTGAVVVEASAPFIKLLSAQGRLISKAGRAGSGPGEFRFISAVSMPSSRSELHLFDPALRRVTRFRLGDSISLVDEKSVPLEVEAACTLGGSLWVVGVHEGNGVLHKLGLQEGKYVVAKSLGTFDIGHPLQSNRLFKEHIVSSRVRCIEESSEVIIASKHLGVLQVVNLKSGVVRVVRIPGVESLEYSAEGKSLTVQRGKKGYSDEVLAIYKAPIGYRAIVGRADRAHRGNGDYTSIREIEFSAEKSGPVKTRLMAEVENDRDGSRSLCYVGSPYPMVAVVYGGGGCRLAGRRP